MADGVEEEGETKNQQEKQKSTSKDKKNLWRVIWGCLLFVLPNWILLAFYGNKLKR